MSDKTVDEKAPVSDTPHAHDAPLAGLALAALGVVFGDIGTSPLYTLKTVFDLAGGTPTPEGALGLLSLIIWTLLLTVSLKYVTFVMRADNDGEGGILALMSLLRMHKHHRPIVIVLGLFGAALIYGDGAITPAISVLSAVEGLKIPFPSLTPYVLPSSVVILIALFALQSQGTERIGWIFGPVMIVWFIALGALGLHGILLHPQVVAAFNPLHGVHYLLTSGFTGYLVLGGVFLSVTGAEALYADMGHIGTRAIRLAWYGLVLPSLLLNYTGQTALFLAGGSIEDNIFYRLCPESLLMPMIILATLATIIASQAIITGAFSMTRQAIQLGWCPRLQIIQTSSQGYGQIYIRLVNWALMVVTVGLTVAFGSSDSLAAAYGIAVSMTMLMTSALLFVTSREIWRWNLGTSLLVMGSFFCVDAVFLGANLSKFREGGWVPVALAVVTYTVLFTWRRGSVVMARKMRALAMPAHTFISRVNETGVVRVAGTAAFLSKVTEQTPPLMIWHVATNKVLHKHVLAVAVVIAQTPWVNEKDRLTIECLAPNFWRIIGHYGFMDQPDVPALLHQAKEEHPELDLDNVTYYIGRETIRHATDGTGIPLWQERIYAFLKRNSSQVQDYLNLPTDSVVEIGRQIAI